ncbi:MAG TPA: YncE family protein [Steroidobacteraceae bacterium]|jgi:DNA-binding beta-propeller fold protein YncE|nr:YncE family protein [Steroidobacteraceae bacterium]
MDKIRTPEYEGLAMASFRRTPCLLLALAASAAAAESSPLPPADYRVLGSWAIGGSGGWDYLALEPGGARLFVTRGDRVDVVDTHTGKLTASIPGTAGVHGVAFAPLLRRGFTSNGNADTVTVFELDTLHVIQQVQVSGKRPDAILFDPEQNHVITANAMSQNLTVLDASTLQIVRTVSLPGRPEYMAEIPGTLYVNIVTDPGKLVAIDAKSLALKATWTLTGCSKPTGLAADAAGRRLLSVCANQIMAVTDAGSGRQVAHPGIGAGPDAAAFDSALGLAFSSNGGDGTLTVVREVTPDQFTVLASVNTQVSARTMALDPVTHRIYLAAATLGPTPSTSADDPNPRPPIVPNSFAILVAQPK